MAQPEGQISTSVATSRAARIPVGQLPASLSPVVYIVHDEVARQKLLRQQQPQPGVSASFAAATAAAAAAAAEGRQKSGTSALPLIGNGNGNSGGSKSNFATHSAVLATSSSSCSTTVAAAAAAAAPSVVSSTAASTPLTPAVVTGVATTALSASTPPVTPLASTTSASPVGSGSSCGGASVGGGTGGGSSSGAGRYQCVHCGRSCAKPSVLEKHLRAHTGERPYPCLPCGFSFKTKSNLYKHRKSRSHLQRVGVSVPDASLTPTGATSAVLSRRLRLRTTNVAAEDDGSGQCSAAAAAAVDELSSAGGLDDDVDDCCVDYFEDVDDVDASGNGSGDGGVGGEDESLSNSSTLSCSVGSCGSGRRAVDDKEGRDGDAVPAVEDEGQEPPAKRPALSASGTAGGAVAVTVRCRDQTVDVRNPHTAATAGCDVPGDPAASSTTYDASSVSRSMVQATDSSCGFRVSNSSSSTPAALVAVELPRIRVAAASAIPAAGSRTPSSAMPPEDDTVADAAFTRSADSPASAPPSSSSPSPAVQLRQQQQLLPTKPGGVAVTADKVALRERIQHLIDTNSLIMSTPLAEVQRFKRVSRLPSLNGLPTDEPPVAVVGLIGSAATSCAAGTPLQQPAIDSYHPSSAAVSSTVTKAACPIILLPVASGVSDLVGARLISDVTAAAVATPTVFHLSPKPSAFTRQLSSPSLPESRADSLNPVHGSALPEQSELALSAGNYRTASAVSSVEQQQQQQQQQQSCTVADSGGVGESRGQSCSGSAARPAAVSQKYSQVLTVGQPAPPQAARSRDGCSTPECRSEQSLPLLTGTGSAGCSGRLPAVTVPTVIATAKPLGAQQLLAAGGLTSAVKLEPGTLVQVVLPVHASQSSPSAAPSAGSAVPSPSGQLAPSHVVVCKTEPGRLAAAAAGLPAAASPTSAATAATVLSPVQLQRLHAGSAIHIEVSTKEVPSGGKPPEPSDRGMKRALSDAGSPRPKLAHTFHQVEGAKIAGLVSRASVRRQLSEARDASGGSSNSSCGGSYVACDAGALQSTAAPLSSASRHPAAAAVAGDAGAASAAAPAAMVVPVSGGRLPIGASLVPAVIIGTIPPPSASPVLPSSSAAAVGKSDRSAVFGNPPTLLFTTGAPSSGQLVQHHQELPSNASTDAATSLSVPDVTRGSLDSITVKCAAGQLPASSSGVCREVPIPAVSTNGIGSNSSACDAGGLPTASGAGGSSSSSIATCSTTLKEQLRGRILQRRSMSTEHGGIGGGGGGSSGSLPSPAANVGSTVVPAADLSSCQPQALLSSVISSSLTQSAIIDVKSPAGKSASSACDSPAKAIVAGGAVVSAVATGLIREAADAAGIATTCVAGSAASYDNSIITGLTACGSADLTRHSPPPLATDRTSFPADNRLLPMPATNLVFLAAAPQGSSGAVTAAANPAAFAGRLVRVGVLPPVSASVTTASSSIWPYAAIDTSRPCSVPLVAVAPHCVWPAATAAPLQGLSYGKPVRLDLSSAAMSSMFFASPASSIATASRGSSAATTVVLLQEKAARFIEASGHRDDTVPESGRSAVSSEPSTIVGPVAWLSSAAFRQDLIKAGGSHVSTAVADRETPMPSVDATPAATSSGRSNGLAAQVGSASIGRSGTEPCASDPDGSRWLHLQPPSASPLSVKAASTNSAVEEAASAVAKRRVPPLAGDGWQNDGTMTASEAADVGEPLQKRRKPDCAVQLHEAGECVEVAVSKAMQAESCSGGSTAAQPSLTVAHGKQASTASHMMSVAATPLSSFLKLSVPCTSSMLLSALALPDQRTIYRVTLQPVTQGLCRGRTDPAGITASSTSSCTTSSVSSSCSGDSFSPACIVAASSYKRDAKLAAPVIASDGGAKVVEDRVPTVAEMAPELTQPAPTTTTKWCLHRPQLSTALRPAAGAQPCYICPRECATAAAATAAATAAFETPTSTVPLHCTRIPPVQCLAPVQVAGQLRPEIVYATSRGDVRSIITHSSYWSYKSKLRLVGGSAQSPASANRPKLSVSEAATTVSCSDVGQIDRDTEPMSLVAPLSGQGELRVANHQGEQLPVSSKSVKGLVRSLSTPETADDDGEKRVKIFVGGFKSEEEYTYIRGRGRGKYVCERCGIRCKKPSMLKKHIRTHTDLRPYSCKHCEFSFKTKGNLTKHMRSKAHHKRCLELGIVPVPTNVDDSQIDAVALAQQQEISRESRIKGEDDLDDELRIVEGDYDDEGDDDDDEDDEDEDDDTDDDDDHPAARASDEFGRLAVSSDVGARLLPAAAAAGRLVKEHSAAAAADRRKDSHVPAAAAAAAGLREQRSKPKSGVAVAETVDVPQQYLKDARHAVVKHEHGAAAVAAAAAAAVAAAASAEQLGRAAGVHARSLTASAARGQAAITPAAARESIDNEVARSLLDLSKMPVPCHSDAQQKQLPTRQQLPAQAGASRPNPPASAADGKSTLSKMDGVTQRATRGRGGGGGRGRGGGGGGGGGENRLETFVGVALTMNKPNASVEPTADTRSKLPEAATTALAQRRHQLMRSSMMSPRSGCGQLATEDDPGAAARRPVVGVSAAAAAAAAAEAVAASSAGEWCQVCEVHLLAHADPIEHRRSRLHMDRLEERGHLLAPMCLPSSTAVVLASGPVGATKAHELLLGDSGSLQQCSADDATNAAAAPATGSNSDVRQWRRQRSTSDDSSITTAVVVAAGPLDGDMPPISLAADGVASRSRRFRHPHSNQQAAASLAAGKLPMPDFACPQPGCGKQYSNKDLLKNHIGTHIDNPGPTAHDRPGTKCDVCDKKFKSISGLKQHLVTHAQLRPYVCEYCDAGFTAAQSLKFHLRTHTQERPYICTHCGDTFARSDHLKQHTKRHLKNQEPHDNTDAAPATAASTHKHSLARDAIISSSFVLTSNLKAHPPEVPAADAMPPLRLGGSITNAPTADASARHASAERRKDSADSCVTDQTSLPTMKPTSLRTHTGAHTMGSHSDAFAGKEG